MRSTNSRRLDHSSSFDATGPEALIISTDASGFAIGGVLSQDQNGEERVVAYESRRLKEAERNYPTHKELLLSWRCWRKKWRHSH
jgi:hypothetical protein